MTQRARNLGRAQTQRAAGAPRQLAKRIKPSTGGDINTRAVAHQQAIGGEVNGATGDRNVPNQQARSIARGIRECRIIHPATRDVELEPWVNGHRIACTGGQGTRRNRNVATNEHISAAGFFAGVVKPSRGEAKAAAGRERHRPLDSNLPQAGEIEARKTALLERRGIDDQSRSIRLEAI